MINSEFRIEKYSNPPSDCYPVYAWMWNEELSKETIQSRIDEMCERNIWAVYVIPMPKEFRPNSMTTNLYPPYLSDGYFEMLSFAVDYAHQKGINFWLYDEGGWPSGNANHEVTKDAPGLSLVYVDNGEPKTLSWFSDLTNIKATEKFVSLTHEKHKIKMGESFKKMAPFVFTDEPNIFETPYTEAIKSEFKKRTGKELDPQKISSADDAEFNIIYHDVCAHVFAKNYFLPIKKWCNENSMNFSGHLNGEDETLGFRYGYHHSMRLLRIFDVPGVDTIWGQIFPGQRNMFFPRLASSAANQNGGGLSLSESYAVYGTMPFDLMRYVAGFQFVRGINILNCMLLMYDDSKYYFTQERPSLCHNQPCGEYLKSFNLYMAKIQYIMRLGKPCTNCALYMPLRSFWAKDSHSKKVAESYENMGLEIEKNHGQFDIVDDDFILMCNKEKLKTGKLQGENVSYDVLYIPEDRFMPLEARENLAMFESGGGRVCRVGNEKFYPLLDISGDRENLRVHKRICKNCDIYLVFNESDKCQSAKINLPQNAYELDLFTDKKYEVSSEYKFEYGEIKIFVVPVHEEKTEKRPNKIKLCELNKFRMKPIKKFTINSQGSVYEPVEGKSFETGLCDWNIHLGKDFSGECRYETEFAIADTTKNLILSLGEVNYGCRVCVNGHEIGEKCMSPYVFHIDKSFVKKNNRLEVFVSNTAANTLVHNNLPEEWEEKNIGPYHQKALELEKHSVKGGMLGPVELFEEA